MSASITILKPGFFTTIQDSGRRGYAHLGVPESGAIDASAFRLANLLLNNNPNEAMLECTLVGPEIQFNNDTHFVITGGSPGASVNGLRVQVGVPIFAKAQEIVTLSKISKGSRCYIAFAGGINSETVLGSKSWYKPITEYAMISKGMILWLGKSRFGTIKGARLRVLQSVELEKEIVPTLKVYKGIEFSKLTSGQQSQLTETKFTISNLWNRMAIQLAETLDNSLNSIDTSPVIPGTVQLTPSGKLIILMNDCQVTGGYSRVLQVSDAGLSLLAQMQQGSKLLLSVT